MMNRKLYQFSYWKFLVWFYVVARSVNVLLVVVASSSTVVPHRGPNDECRENQVRTFIKTGFHEDIEEYFYIRNSSTVFLRDSSKTVFISENDGVGFKPVDLLRNTIRLLGHAYESNRIYALGLTTKAFYSRDGGKTFNSLNLPAVPHFLGGQVMFFNEADPDSLIYRGTIACEQPPCKTRLFYTIDQGFTWSEVSNPSMESCLWLRSEGITEGMKHSVLCMEKIRTNEGKDLVRLVRSDDRFSHFRVILNRSINAFRIFRRHILVAVETENPTRELALYVSSDGDQFTKAVFPSEVSMKPNAFTILESTDFSIFLTNGLDGPFGHLYASNRNGTRFSTLLKYVHQDSRRITDYERVAGLEGVLIVNVVKNPLSAVFSTSNIQLETLISFNDGGSWNPLRAPKNDMSGKEYDCDEKPCKLHLHSVTDRYRPGYMFSASSTRGLLIGVGNVGDRLKPISSADTFLSRDGGLTWTQISKGSSIYQFGNHGSLLILVERNKKSHTIVYSLNEGKSWCSLSITDRQESDLKIRDVITEPSSTKRSFLLIGTLINDTLASVIEEPVVIHLDFSSLYSRKCEMPRDFEAWRLSDRINDHACHMGHNVTYYRRKTDADCYIDKEYEAIHVDVDHCECTRNDFECDVDFYLSSNGTCLPQLPNSISSVEPAECRYSKTYKIPSGYRRISGDSCINGELLNQPIEVACPSSHVEKATLGHALWLLFMNYVAMGACTSCLIYAARHPELFQRIPWLHGFFARINFFHQQSYSQRQGYAPLLEDEDEEQGGDSEGIGNFNSIPANAIDEDEDESLDLRRLLNET